MRSEASSNCRRSNTSPPTSIASASRNQMVTSGPPASTTQAPTFFHPPRSATGTTRTCCSPARATSCTSTSGLWCRTARGTSRLRRPPSSSRRSSWTSWTASSRSSKFTMVYVLGAQLLRPRSPWRAQRTPASSSPFEPFLFLLYNGICSLFIASSIGFPIEFFRSALCSTSSIFRTRTPQIRCVKSTRDGVSGGRDDNWARERRVGSRVRPNDPNQESSLRAP